MRVISIANQKGGCGKTTTAINLSACLAHQQRKTLLIDMDPQGHSSMGLDVDINGLEKTILDVIGHPDHTNASLCDIVLEISKDLHIAPSDISLSLFEQHLSGVHGRESRLKEAVAGLHRTYDYVIIDCPPSLGLLTFNSLIASTEVIVPVEMSLFSLHGISRLFEIIGLVREQTGHKILMKVIATMYDKRTRISNEVFQNIKNNFNESMFRTVIHSNVKLREAASFGKPIVEYEKRARGFIDYMAFAKEVTAQEEMLGMKLLKDAKPRHFAKKVKKQFIIHAPEAADVKIVGSFNNWIPADASIMERQEDGTWTKNFFLAPGSYQYKFVVDGVWVEDNTNSKCADNSYGGKNSVIEIR
jgi:cellulose biosynthesis protein BcsQ